jgi:hypothetical protein
MSTCLFLTFRPHNPSALEGEIARLSDVLRTVPRLRNALVHTASRASDPYLDDGPPPPLMLQLYFAELPDLEATIARDGALKMLLSPDAFPQLANAEVTQQAMLVRRFTVNGQSFNPAAPYCTYLVAYEGEAEDLNAWLDHYLVKHTKHMADFPGIRELEVYTRLDWVGALPWRRANCMQRNKVAFDSAEALTHALNSPVRHRMREDFRSFPAFTGPNTHFAMTTHAVRPHEQ